MTYSGPATLIDDDGNETDVDITITVTGTPALQEWSAYGTAIHGQADPMNGTVLRLPNGNEGKVLVTNYTFGSHASISIVGASGPPPAA